MILSVPFVRGRCLLDITHGLRGDNDGSGDILVYLVGYHVQIQYADAIYE